MGQFLDHVFIEISSGDGGNGIVAWRREKYEPMGGPAGGNGGRGGHVFIEATNDLNTLIDFRYKMRFQADNGQRGGPKGKHGKNADDLVIKVPAGTLVRDATYGNVVADLVHVGQRVLVAEGGRGGRGNVMLATPTRRAPHFCEPGERGVTRKLELELKILADVGIIGLPNAGKSTLLSVVSAAKPKIADYPFSTLEPNLGVVRTPDGEQSFVMADIPGLVEGASRGIGLGHDFLRHTERTRLLLHMVDITSQTITEDIESIDKELELYSDTLAGLPEILVLNKTDLLLDEEAEAIAAQVSGSRQAADHSPLVMISAAARQGVDDLIKQIATKLQELKPEVEEEPEMLVQGDDHALDHSDTGWEITRKKGIFTISGDRVERLVTVTNMRDPESLHHLHYVLRSMGVIDALIAQGAKTGSEVQIAGITFAFGDEWG